MILYLLSFILSSAMALNFGCFNHSQIDMTSDNITTDLLASVDLEFCYNKSNLDFIVVFNYYHQTRTCELFYNYSLTYKVMQNSASQMCILHLPESHKADRMSCSIRDSTWDPNGVTVAGLENELNSPYAVIVSNDDSSMFVADTRHNRILQYNANSSTYIMIYDGTDTGTKIAGPMAIALADDGSELIVASYADRRVLRWSLATKNSSLVSFSYVTGATGLAIDKNKTIFVAQSLSREVIRYETDTDPYWGHGEWYDFSLDGIKHMIIVNDSIYMAQSKACRVIKISLVDQNNTVVVVAGNGRLGSTPDRLRFPWGVTVDSIEGQVFVSDSQNHRIQLWLIDATEGITIAGITSRPGARANQLNDPHGLTLGPDRSLFVADTNNGRIQKFQRYCIV